MRYLAVWTALGLFFAVQVYMDRVYVETPVTWGEAIFLALTEWYLWALLFPLIRLLARRFPFERRRWWFSLGVHLPATFVLTLGKVIAETSLIQLTAVTPPQPPNMAKLNGSLLTCWLMVVVSHALMHYRASQERERRALDLQARLAQAQLQLLKSQLQPHFLFNTLHAISTLMHRDVPAAEQMLTRLSDLLRMALDSSELQEVRLKVELEFTRLYLEIQECRFRDRLQVAYDVEPATLDALVPNMVLQPLAENAIQHGVARRAAAGRIEIGIRRDGDRLELRVSDDGPGLANDVGPPAEEGIGLSNTRARLRRLYGDDHELSFNRAAAGGLEVRLTIPFNTSANDEAKGADQDTDR